MRRKIIFLLLAAFCAAQTGNLTAEAAAVRDKVTFDLRVVAEGSRPEVLTEAVIDGPEGTDFNIDLKTKGFEMKAEFLTDRVSDSEMLLRVRLETRRSYGLSQNGLPLYEEDRQEHTVRMAFDESVVLLPFGKNSGGDTLKIEILPGRKTSAAAEELNIDFLKNLTSGEIAINARKVPHDYEVEAQVLFEGAPVARGDAIALFRKTSDVAIKGSLDFGLDIEIEEFIRSRPTDLASVIFKLKDREGKTINSGRGIGDLGREFRYSLEQELGTGYELVFRVKEKKQ